MHRFRHRPRFPTLSRRRIVGILVSLVLLDLLLCGVGAAAGSYELLATQQDLRGGNAARIITQGQALRDRLGVASLAFGVARLCWWPWRPLASLVARAGGPARMAGAVGPFLDLGADASLAGAHALDGAQPLLAAQQKHGSGQAGVRLLAGLQAGRGSLQAAQGDLANAEHDWRALDAAALPAGLGARLASVGRLLPTADEALRVALDAPALLGATGSRTYLLVPENPWDLRATGGFAGTVALLHVQGGRLTLTSEASDAVDAAPGRPYIPPPLPLLAYEHFSNWLYRDANWSPDFPTSARLLRYFYWLGQQHTATAAAPGHAPERHAPDTHAPDGVIAFDSSLLGPLLGLTGPVQLRAGSTTVTLTAANGVATLDRFINGTGVVNKEIAKEAYSAVFKRLEALPASKMPDVARVMGAALRQRHLLLWTPDATVAPILARHGWDGAIDGTRADYVYVVDTNVHYNKINQRVHEAISYHAEVQPDRSLRSTLTITYDNQATPTNIPPPQNNTLYEDFVRVYVPLGSRLLGVAGLTQPWTAQRAYDKTVFSGYLRLPSLARATVTFTYLVPPNALADPSTYHLTVQKQPGAAATPLHLLVTTRAPGVRVNGGTQWAWQGRLDADVTLTTGLAGGHARPVPLAYDDAPVSVAPGAQIEPWTVLPATLPPLP